MRVINKRRKAVAIFLLLTFLFQLCIPIQTYALTSGPSQPEVQSFEPVGTTDMVDLFTGDFNYNIPLLDVEGYPINISYHSGISMDQEASWTGLGWNINPGVINRNMRGLPDDFKGDEIKQIFDTKPHKTWGVNTGVALELFGKEMKKQDKTKSSYSKSKTPNSFNLGFSLGIKSDNYRGMGFSFGLSPAYTVSNGISENCWTATDGKGAGYGYSKSESKDQNFKLDLNFDSQNGFDANPSYARSASKSNSEENECESKSSSTSSSKSVSMGFNSRAGFTGLTLGISKSNSQSSQQAGAKAVNSGGGFSNGGTFLTQNHPSYQPSAKNKMNTYSLSTNFKVGLEMFATNPEFDLNGYYSWQKFQKERTLYGFGSMYDYLKNDKNFLQDFNRYNEGAYSNATLDLPLSTTTPDYFSVSGQGISGAYKAKYSYTPMVYDDEVYSNSTQAGLGAEMGIGNTFKLGINASYMYTSNRSGVKKLTDDETHYFKYSKFNVPADFEESYFKYVGEKTPVDVNYYNLIQTDRPVKPSDFGLAKRVSDLLKSKYSYTLNDFDISKISLLPSSAAIKDVMSIYNEKAIKKEREKRNQVFQYLTVDQISKVPELALEQYIKSYPMNTLEYLWNGSSTQPSLIDRANVQLGHHISEIKVLADDGRRYVYGIPAMNTTQQEFTFSLGQSPTVTNQIGFYTLSGSDSSIFYQQTPEGQVNYMYHEQDIPKYAHSYLLTGILSDDYIDILNDGITDDDYGTAVKFTYTRIDSNFHWRSPYPRYSANYQDGMKSNKNDNKANFVSGEKEMSRPEIGLHKKV